MNPLNLGLVVHVKNYISDAENTLHQIVRSFLNSFHFKDSVKIQWVLVALPF